MRLLGHFREKKHFTRNTLATSQENATSLAKTFKTTFHFTGKCAFTGNGAQSISLKLCFMAEI